MWEFRPIGKYYELLVDGDSIYLCRKQDTIIQAVLEDLCKRHNTEMAKYENLDVEITSCDEAYLNGLEDGKEEAAQERYNAGYDEGYQLGKADGYGEGYRRGLADALGKDEKKKKNGEHGRNNNLSNVPHKFILSSCFHYNSKRLVARILDLFSLCSVSCLSSRDSICITNAA